MPMATEESLLLLLQACADCAPAPLYPAQFARDRNLDRAQLDHGLDELRRRGLVKLTDWVKDHGQGRALTEAGEQALKTRRLTPAPAAAAAREDEAADQTNAYGRGEIVRRAVFDPPIGWVTRGLLIANIAFFIFGALYAYWRGWDVADYLQGDGRATTDVLIDLGALHPALVFRNGDQRPQYERIVLFFFLHVGFLHLLMNMYFLGTLGRQIEAMWGSIRFLVIYFVAGIVSGCMVLLLAPLLGRTGLTAGASGCLFGIFVAMIVWFALNHQHLPRNLIQAWSRNLGINVILLVVINFLPNVSWQGHLGGAVGGLLAALLLHVQRFHPVRAIRILALLGVPLIPIGFFVAVLWQAGRL
jgi:membrane associated rhomboid family serine protease